jgi:AraC family L-rhamnose operon regulatory protein RhaS
MTQAFPLCKKGELQPRYTAVTTEAWKYGQNLDLHIGQRMAKRLTDRALDEELPEWGVLVLESHHSPQFTMEWRTHSFIKVVYVLRGVGEFYLDDKSIEFQTADVVVVPAGTKNRIVDSSASSLYVCCIAPHLFQFDKGLIPLMEQQLIQNDRRFTTRAASLMRRMVHTQRTATGLTSVGMVTDAMRLIQLVLERVRRTPKHPRESDDRSTVRRYIQSLPDRFFEEESIDTTCHRLGIPRRTFTQIFAELAGETWLAYVRRLAIEHATRQLKETTLPVTSIAFECGFNDLSTFYRQFKKQTGRSPTEFRSVTNSVEGICGSQQDGIIHDAK